VTRVAPLCFKARLIGACLRSQMQRTFLAPISFVRLCHNHRWWQL